MTPAVILGGSVEFTECKFNFLVEDSTGTKIYSDLRVFVPNLSIVVSKKVSKVINCYAGSKIIFRRIEFVDKNYYYKISGEEILASINLGSRIFVTERESINIELGYTPGSYSVSIGIMLGI